MYKKTFPLTRSSVISIALTSHHMDLLKTLLILLIIMGDTFNFSNLEEELNKMGNASNFNNHEAEWYEGNLKKNHAFFILDQHFYLLTDCDNNGNLQNGSYVLVEFAGVEKTSGKDFLLMCHKI